MLAAYYLLHGHRKAQNRLLLVASLAFYAWGEPKFVFVMMAMVVLDWALALAMRGSGGGRSFRARALLVVAVASNVAVLFVAKYLSLSVGILNAAFGAGLNDPAFPLPIGVSFFTFQSLSYVIDVYRGEPAQRNVLDLGLYVSLFPQLVAGPIVRYTTFEPQIAGRVESLGGFSSGARRFVVGLSKKVLLANPLGLVADHAFDGADATALLLWMGVVAYTLQIFFDFSGYSDMAIGLGRMFGFEFPENFDYPYTSKTVSEFWRRWHISLGSWFRDYVYFPLGGSRVAGKGRLAFNLFVVWSLTGIWHGADLTFLAWGLMYFALVAAEKLMPRWRAFLEGSRVAGHVVTMAFVMAGWVLFRAGGFGEACSYYAGLAGFGVPVWDDPAVALLRENAVFFLAGITLSLPVAPAACKRLEGSRVAGAVGWLAIVALVLLFALDVACIVKGFYNPFIYFNF